MRSAIDAIPAACISSAVSEEALAVTIPSVLSRGSNLSRKGASSRLDSITGTSTDDLITAFQSCTLAKAEWTHQAHLRVGLWHVDRYGPADALDRLRTGIRALNESHGNANSDSAGYHETITRFYVLLMAQFLAAAERSTSLDELTARFIARYPTSDLPLRYYSRERLFSVAARREWVEPDLRPLEEFAVHRSVQ